MFYAVTQAIFLIFCFRWRDLGGELEEENVFSDDSKQKWMRELDVLKRVVTSVLNPLKVMYTISSL